MAAPRVTSPAVSSWATPMRPEIERTWVRMKPSRMAPVAMPIRNRTRMIVKT